MYAKRYYRLAKGFFKNQALLRENKLIGVHIANRTTYRCRDDIYFKRLKGALQSCDESYEAKDYQ